MWYTVREILSWTNINDSWCKSKLDRFSNLLSWFAIEVYDLYPQKVIERFSPAICKAQLQTKNPIAKVWGFFWKWCNTSCVEEAGGCCAGFKKLLMTELYWDNLDQNSYSWKYPNIVTMKLPEGLTDAFIVYSKWFPKVTSMNDEIDIDPYMARLLRLYMKAEYALESDNDVNMSANYRSLFQTELKKLQEMYMNSIKYIFPWALSITNR